MDAMILAAGLGTRLRPLTDTIPKPLLPVAGVPILERVARRLIAAGADRLIINTSHLGEQIARFVHERDDFGVDVHISHEPDGPLDTGGGLLRAAPYFRRVAPFYLHNGDVLSEIPLDALMAAHSSSNAIATLAVLPPRPERYLLFDQEGLCGLARRHTGEEQFARPPAGATKRFEFAGIHVISPAIFERLTETGTFSIFRVYLRLIREGNRIQPFLAEHSRWIDIGSVQGLAEAEAWLGASSHD